MSVWIRGFNLGDSLFFRHTNVSWESLSYTFFSQILHWYQNHQIRYITATKLGRRSCSIASRKSYCNLCLLSSRTRRSSDFGILGANWQWELPSSPNGFPEFFCDSLYRTLFSKSTKHRNNGACFALAFSHSTRSRWFRVPPPGMNEASLLVL